MAEQNKKWDFFFVLKNWHMHCPSVHITFLIYCLPVCAMSVWAVESIPPSPCPTSTLFKYLALSLRLTATAHTFSLIRGTKLLVNAGREILLPHEVCVPYSHQHLLWQHLLTTEQTWRLANIMRSHFENNYFRGKRNVFLFDLCE